MFLKLRTYRQKSVANRFYPKLAAKYYGPYKILEKIGKVAYRLQLPQGSKIHDVFHVSQLKKAVGTDVEVLVLPPVFSTETEAPLQPLDVLATRYSASRELELLVTWKGKDAADDSWMLSKEFIACFHSFELEGKLGFDGRGIDKYQKTYFRKKKTIGGKYSNADVEGNVGDEI